MDNLIMLLALLGLALVVMVMLAERFGSAIDTEQQAKLARWVFPLIGILLVLTLLNQCAA